MVATLIKRRARIIQSYLLLFFLTVLSFGLSAQTVWTGTFSSDWHTDNNWSTGMTPTAADDVVIPMALSGPSPVISADAAAKSVTIDAGAVLTINATFTLEINNSTGDGMISSGTIANNGNIDIGNNMPVNGRGIVALDGAFNNNTGASIRVNNVLGTAIANIGADFMAFGSITIGDLGGVAGDGIVNQSSFLSVDVNIESVGLNGVVNDASGTSFTHFTRDMIIRDFGQHGVWNKQGTFTNEGRIIITSSLSAAGFSLKNDGLLINQPCKDFSVNDEIYNDGVITNEGIWFQNAPQVSKFGDFTNNGVVRDVFNDPGLLAITNNEIIISSATSTSPTSITNAFSIGGQSNFTIDGVFTDFSLSTSAGTYDASTNDFTASPDLIIGINNLVVSVTDQNCPFAYRMAWKVEVYPPNCNTFYNKCWTGAVDDSWSNASNWYPLGVPTTCEQVYIPEAETVVYDYTGNDTIDNVLIEADALLTISTASTLRAESCTDVPYTLLNNRGKVVNNGSIVLTNAIRRGVLSQGQFDNYGSLLIDKAALAANLTSGHALWVQTGRFDNFTGGSIQILEARENGLQCSFASSLYNHPGATINIDGVLGIGLLLEDQSTFENMSTSTINISNVSDPSDKLHIEVGSILLGNPTIDVRP